MSRWIAFLPLLIGTVAAPLTANIGEIDINAGPPAEAPPQRSSDHSALWIRAKTRVTILMIDRQGRKTGVEPKTYKVLQQIPGSHCEVEFIENAYTGEARAEADQRLAIEPAPAGEYQIILTGLQAGPYEILIDAQSSDGSSEPSKNLEGLISEGQSRSARLRFDPSPNATLSVVDGR